MLFQLSPFFMEFGHEEEFDLESSTMPGVAAEADHQSGFRRLLLLPGVTLELCKEMTFHFASSGSIF